MTKRDIEGPIQKAIVKYLRTQYPGALIFSVPNELASKAGAGLPKWKQQQTIRNIQARAKDQGMLPGMADLCMWWNGQFFAFEVKAKGNYQQDNQKDCQRVTEANQGVYAVVRSIDDVQAVMAENVASVPIKGTIS